jgi:hypothetical protein
MHPPRKTTSGPIFFLALAKALAIIETMTNTEKETMTERTRSMGALWVYVREGETLNDRIEVFCFDEEFRIFGDADQVSDAMIEEMMIAGPVEGWKAY